MSPKKKAVLGVMIGLTIAFMFVVIPEFLGNPFKTIRWRCDHDQLETSRICHYTFL